MELNPLRAFDSADEGTQKVMAEAPRLLDALEGEDARALRGRTRPARPGRRPLRGRPDDGARARLLHAHGLRAPLRPPRRPVAGGRGRPLRRPDRAARRAADPGDRLGDRDRARRAGARTSPSASRRSRSSSSPTTGTRERALALATELRRAGVPADLDLAERSQKGQMKQADRSGAARTLILDGDGATLRDMESGEQRRGRPRPRGGGAGRPVATSWQTAVPRWPLNSLL